MRLPDGLELDYQRHLRGLATTTDSMVYGQLVRPLFADDLPLEADQR
jgi:hypothetical protein